MPGPWWVPSTIDGKLAPDNHRHGMGAIMPGSQAERVFCDNHERAECIAEGEGSEAYEYDMYWLGRVGGEHYLFHTSGCSCPSPDETWSLIQSGSEDELRAYLTGILKQYRDDHEAAVAGGYRRWGYVGDGMYPLLESLVKSGWLDGPIPPRDTPTDW